MNTERPRRQCAILAGGKGTRMLPMTESLPKSLLPVGGRPFIDHQLAWLASEGITDVLCSIGYLGEMIRRHVGSGGPWGLRVDYAEEGSRPLGTAGALRLASSRGMLDEAFAALYGDSFLRVSIPGLWNSFLQSGAPAMMTVLRNQDQWDRSNTIFESGRVILDDKGARSPRMQYVDYGISVLTRGLIERGVPENEPADLAPLLTRLSREGRLAGYEVFDRFYEIGSPAGLRELEAYLSAREGCR